MLKLVTLNAHTCVCHKSLNLVDAINSLLAVHNTFNLSVRDLKSALVWSVPA